MAVEQTSAMTEHAPEILQGAFWIIGILGALIVALFGAGVAVAKWAVQRYEDVQRTALSNINERLDRQDSTLAEIKEFMSAELRELREWFHRLDKEVHLIKERFYNGRDDH